MTISMSRSLTAAVLALGLSTTLAACGDETDTATDPATSSSSPSPSQTPSETQTPSESTPPPTGSQLAIPATGSAGVTEATVVGGTEGGGSVSTLAFALDGDQAVADFTAELETGLADSVAAAVADLREPGTTTYGTVAAIGCEPPRSVVVEAGEAGFEVTAQVPKSTVQCLAPVTYVVLFAAPDA